MQQHALVADTEAEKGRNLLGGEAVNIAQGDDGPLPLRELSQAILELCTTFSSHRLLFGRARPRLRFAQWRPVSRPLIVWTTETVGIHGRPVALV
jgi:hypothetical protein